jgi:predicted alpha/beta hydrolase family esterase
MGTVLIVPGLNGSDENHWQSHWERRLPDTLRVQQDDWSVPDLALWAGNIVEAARGKTDLWIVAHSFGVLATVHALSQIANQVQGVFLVAPADPHKFGLQSVLTRRVLPVKGALVASHSDPWLSWSAAMQLADDWYLPVLDAGVAGHINVASGHHEWKQGLQWFESLRRSTLDIRQELFVIGEHFSYANDFRIAI